MGLAEKRALEQAQGTQVPDRLKKLKELGFDVAVEIDWKSMEDNLQVLQRVDFGVLSLVQDALTKIAKDDIGKNAIKTGVKKVVVRHSTDKAQAMVSLKGKTLEVVEDLTTAAGNFNAAAIQKAIEAGL